MVIVEVDLATLKVVGKSLDALNPSTTAVPGLTSKFKCVVAESKVNLAVKGLTK